MRKVFGFAALAAFVLVAGCNTISGMGRDVSSVGKTVSKTADNSK